MFRFVPPDTQRVFLDPEKQDPEKDDWIELKKELTVGEKRDMDSAGLGGIDARQDGSDGKAAVDTKQQPDARINVNWSRFSLARTIAYLHDWNATLGGKRMVDQSLAQIRRALGEGPGQVQRPCEVCERPFTVTRADQRMCSGCRKERPHRGVEEEKDQISGGAMVELRCRGVGEDDDHTPCARSVQKPTNRRGPRRCVDCQLAHKRWLVKRSLRRKRAREKKTLQSIADAPRVAQDTTPTALVSHSARVREGRRLSPVERNEEFHSVWDGKEGLTSVWSQQRQEVI